MSSKSITTRRSTNTLPQYEVIMPRSYVEHSLCKRLRFLLDEEVLFDVRVKFRESSSFRDVNAFHLSLLSPVFHKMICGAFKESVDKKLELEEVDAHTFDLLLRVTSGAQGVICSRISEVVDLGKLADRFEMLEVAEALEDWILKQMDLETCCEVLSRSLGSGLLHLKQYCLSMATIRFEELAATSGFARLSVEALAMLLDSDAIAMDKEEDIFAVVMEWFKENENVSCKEELFKYVRFPQMEDNYLTKLAVAPPFDSQLLKDILDESIRIKHQGDTGQDQIRLSNLNQKALFPRIGAGVAWERYTMGGEQKLRGPTNNVLALVECCGRVCGGSGDGKIHIWNKASLEEEFALHVDDGAVVWSLAVWCELLISGHSDGQLAVWDLGQKICLKVLRSHTRPVFALAVTGEWMLSGSGDCTVKVWKMGLTLPLTCDKTLNGHMDAVRCLVTCQGKALSGSSDDSIRVWDPVTGAQEALLAGHTEPVYALTVGTHALYSASSDGTIRMWSLGSWNLLHTFDAYTTESGQYPRCLAISGDKLVSGSIFRSGNGANPCELRVWDVTGRMRCVFTLLQPAGAVVWAVLGCRGQVWGIVGESIVIWGR